MNRIVWGLPTIFRSDIESVSNVVSWNGNAVLKTCHFKHGYKYIAEDLQKVIM